MQLYPLTLNRTNQGIVDQPSETLNTRRIETFYTVYGRRTRIKLFWTVFAKWRPIVPPCVHIRPARFGHA